MMGIEVPETCWAYHKCNKTFSDIQLVFLLYAYATMHGQTHIKFSRAEYFVRIRCSWKLCDYPPLFLIYVDRWSAIFSVGCQIQNRSSGEHPVQYTFRSRICSRTTTPNHLHLCTAFFSFCLPTTKCSAVIYCAEHWLLFPIQTLIEMHWFLRGMWRKHRLDTGFLYRRNRSQ